MSGSERIHRSVFSTPSRALEFRAQTNAVLLSPCEFATVNASFHVCRRLIASSNISRISSRLRRIRRPVPASPFMGSTAGAQARHI